MTAQPETEIPPARPAATVCLLRDEVTMEVLMVRRSRSSSVMPSAWVFPGGTVDPIDSSPLARRLLPGAPPELQPVMAAGVRELVEEVGIWLTADPVAAASGALRPEGSEVYAVASMAGVTFAADRLVHFANWVTPTMIPKRFDTHFFVAPAPPGALAEPDGTEIDAAEWVAPRVAIDAATAGRWRMAPPTIHTLHGLAGGHHVEEFLVRVGGLGPVVALRPRLRPEGDTIEVVVPGDPGFDDLKDLPPDPAMMEAITRMRPAGSANDAR